jgi:glycosyltransferase involved in cell wall biosynthesis
VIYNGLNFENYNRVRQEPQVPTIGYLARMIHGKGLTTLVRGFIELARRESVPGVRLRVAGAKTSSDDQYVAGLQAKLAKAGLTHRVTWEPNLTFDEKVAFLHEVSVFSVPATYGEAFGLYVVEAQACGLPVVQPQHGAFPELLDLTTGGVLTPSEDVSGLADAFEKVLLDHAHRDDLSVRGRERTRHHFSSEKMAETFEGLMIEAVTEHRQPATGVPRVPA